MIRSRKRTAKPSNWPMLSCFSIVIIIVIVLGAFYFWKDVSDRYRFEVNNKEVGMIYEGSIKEMGAIPSEELDSRYHPVLIGNGFWQSIACIDQTCPQISKKWAIQINIGDEQSLMIGIARKYGYEITLGDKMPCDDGLRICNIFARKTGFSLDLSMSEVGQEALPLAESSKQWRYLNMTIRLVPKELNL